MANVVTTQILVDGPRNTVIRVAGVLDTSDLAPTVIANPATLVGTDDTGALKAATFRVMRIDHSIEAGISLDFAWEATAPVVFARLSGSQQFICSKYGGVDNNALAAGKTGSITLATQGWVAAAVLSFSFVIELVKVQSGVVAAIPGTPASQGYVDFAGTIPLL